MQSQLGAVITTGGGFSTYFKTPSWQAAAVSGYLAAVTGSASAPAPGFNPQGRGIPDVSLIGVSYQVSDANRRVSSLVWLMLKPLATYRGHCSILAVYLY